MDGEWVRLKRDFGWVEEWKVDEMGQIGCG